jgi:hypothetical protein
VFNANSAWTVIASIAHNLIRWTSVIRLPADTMRGGRTMRRRLLEVPGRPTHTARQWTLHLRPVGPWQHDFIRALAQIRALPAAARAPSSRPPCRWPVADRSGDHGCRKQPSKTSPQKRPPPRHPRTKTATAVDPKTAHHQPPTCPDAWIQAKDPKRVGCTRTLHRPTYCVSWIGSELAHERHDRHSRSR